MTQTRIMYDQLDPHIISNIMNLGTIQEESILIYKYI